MTLFAQLTYPPPPGERPAGDQLVTESRKALFKGDPQAAYKYLLLSENVMAEDAGWRELFFLTLIGLGNPLDASAFVAVHKNPSEMERLRSGLLLKREGFKSEAPRFLTGSPAFAVPKEVARKAVSIAANGNSLFILTPEAFYTYPLDGSPQAFRTMNGGKEVMTGDGGLPFVLTSHSLVSPSGTVQLPLRITEALSFARAPGNCFYILDSTGKVFLLDQDGKIIEERQILIRKPSRIRTDDLGRVFILSAAQDDISVYSAGFAPIFVLTPENAGAAFGKISDFRPDFAGNMMTLEKGGGDLFLFSFSRHFLGSSGGKAFHADLFWWDGYGELTVLDRRRGSAIKVSL